MAATTKVFSNNNAPACEDADLNGYKDENNNLILASGQSLNTGDNQQTNKSVAHYAAVGQFMSGAGAADAYTIAAPAPRVAPPALKDGMRFRFQVAATNTGGAATLNPFGLGATDIKLKGGVLNPPVNDMLIGEEAEVIYRLTGTFFELVNGAITSKTPTDADAPITSNGTDSDHDIDITAGRILDSTKTTVLEGVAETKQIDAVWAAGTNAGGLASGVSLTADTWYHVFRTDDGSGGVAHGFDTDINAANLLADTGGSKYRLLVSVLTDGSSNIVGYSHQGNNVDMDDISEDFNNASPGTAANLVTATVPTGYPVDAKVSVRLANSTQAFALITATLQTDVAPADINAQMQVNLDSQRASFAANIRTDSSAQYRIRSSVGTLIGLRAHSGGWVMDRSQI
jgi:hypothetical protein